MKNNTLIDTFDDALNHMIAGADVEFCTHQCAAGGETLRPLLQVARGLFALAEEADATAFAPRHDAEALDWATLLGGAKQCSAPSGVATR